MKQFYLLVVLICAATGARSQCTHDPLINENDTIICAGDSVVLSTQTYDSYQWYLSFSSSSVGNPISGATSATYTANGFGWYTVEATVAGCAEFSQTVLVDEYAFLNPYIISSGQSDFCDGDSTMIQIGAGAWGTIQWKKDGVPIPGANGTVYWVKQTGTYIVDASPAVCPNTQLTSGVGPYFTFHTPVTPTITWNGTQLSSSTASSYQWNLDSVAIGGANGQNYTPSASGVYTVTTTDANGCEATSDTLQITVGCPHDPTVVPGDTTVCPGTQFFISTQTYDGYQWYFNSSSTGVGSPLTGETAQSLSVSGPGYYTVAATEAGCTEYSNTIYVDVFATVAPTITWNGTILSSSAASTYQWLLNSGAISGATNQTHTPAVSGIYSVTVTDANGCTTTSDTLHVTVSSVGIDRSGAEEPVVTVFDGKIRIENVRGLNAVNLYTIGGKKVSLNQSGNEWNVNASGGVYLLVIDTKEGRFTKKISLQ